MTMRPTWPSPVRRLVHSARPPMLALRSSCSLSLSSSSLSLSLSLSLSVSTHTCMVLFFVRNYTSEDYEGSTGPVPNKRARSLCEALAIVRRE